MNPPSLAASAADCATATSQVRTASASSRLAFSATIRPTARISSRISTPAFAALEGLKPPSGFLRRRASAATSAAIARDVVAEAGLRKNPLGGFKPSSGANAGVEILDELGAVNRILSEKASPEDAAATREWLLAAAQEAANAAKEGGFMGWHAERVSEGEQRMLDKLAEALG